ncbi:MAG: pseudouridine synthase [Alphaproteobacteria bacterium]
MGTRIAKFLSSASVASRRDAEKMIVGGLVSINGKIITNPATFVSDTDVVCVNGQQVKKQYDTKLYMFHKPINIITSKQDTLGRKTIYDVLPNEYKHLKYIGRLDYKTTGLLLLTNDGEFARNLTLPCVGISRTYIAQVGGNLKNIDVARRGVKIDGVQYRPMKIDVLEKNKLAITVTEGKKNEIRIVLKYCGAPVEKLHRISYGNIKLGDLPVGKIKELDKKTIDAIKKNF